MGFANCGEFEVDECLIRHVKDSEHDTFVDVWIYLLRSYNELDRHTYEHYTVNHSRGEYQRTEHAASGGVVSVHINTLEGVWTIVKSRLRYRARRDLARLDLILDELAYRRSTANLTFLFKWFLE